MHATPEVTTVLPFRPRPKPRPQPAPRTQADPAAVRALIVNLRALIALRPAAVPVFATLVDDLLEESQLKGGA